MSQPIFKGGQRGWAHDEGHAHHRFHTWDALDVGSRFGPRKVHVLLPREIDDPGRRFPTLYLHDGDAVFWPGGAVGKSWNVPGTLEGLRAAGRVEPLIVVAVHPVARDAEYTHVDWAHGARPFGRLPEHAAYLAHEVKGFIDAHYPTLPEARHTAVAGSSHGGLAAFYTAMVHPDAFGKAAAISPSFFSGLDSLRHGARAASLADSALLRAAVATLSRRESRPVLWMSWGMKRTGGEHNSVVESLAAKRGAEMTALLRDRYGYQVQAFDGESPVALGADLFTWVDQVGGHDEEAWAWHLRLVLLAFYGADIGGR